MLARAHASQSVVRGLLWGVSISILLLAVPPLTSAQSRFGMRTGAAGVALIAQIPERVSASWSLQPVPDSLLPGGTRASVLLLENNWHFALGRSVTCSAHLDSAAADAQSAALIPLQRAGDPISSPLDPGSLPAFSLLPRPTPTSITLVSDFDPRLGRQTHVNGLLILHSAASAPEPQTVFITVTAI